MLVWQPPEIGEGLLRPLVVRVAAVMPGEVEDVDRKVQGAVSIARCAAEALKVTVSAWRPPFSAEVQRSSQFLQGMSRMNTASVFFQESLEKA